MRRTSIMATGFVLIFLGIQLNLVETYTLTPRFSNFLSEHASARPNQNSPIINPNNGPVLPNPQINPNTGFTNQNFAQNNSPYSQASFPNGNNGGSLIPQQPFRTFGPPKVIRPPSWISWPVLFLGTVVFLHGFSMRRDY